MDKKSKIVRQLCVNAVIAAAYAVLTIMLAPISYGAVQCRVSEVLCVLPFLAPTTVWGLFLGCVLANLFTGNLFDIIFGSLATLLAALCTAWFGKRGQDMKNRILGCLMPVVFNAVIIGAVITGAYEGLNIFKNFGVFALNGLWVGLGEAVVMFVLGLPAISYIGKNRHLQEQLEKIR